MTEFECILDEPISSAWPVASDWLETFLHDGGNRWDHRIASVMTADAVTAALAHSTRPVRLVGVTTGATAQISLQAHSTGQPQEWTALSPIVEDALPRLRRHTRHCGAAVHLSMAGAETSLWFRLPRPATGIRRLRQAEPERGFGPGHAEADFGAAVSGVSAQPRERILGDRGQGRVASVPPPRVLPAGHPRRRARPITGGRLRGDDHRAHRRQGRGGEADDLPMVAGQGGGGLRGAA